MIDRDRLFLMSGMTVLSSQAWDCGTRRFFARTAALGLCEEGLVEVYKQRRQCRTHSYSGGNLPQWSKRALSPRGITNQISCREKTSPSEAPVFQAGLHLFRFIARVTKEFWSRTRDLIRELQTRDLHLSKFCGTKTCCCTQESKTAVCGDEECSRSRLDVRR